MSQMTLIGLAGPAGVGKTTAATLLGAELGYPVFGFADPIREVVFKLFPAWDEWHLSAGKDRKSPTYGVSPRHAMRVIGDHGRAMQHDLYVRAMARRVDRARGQGAAGVVIHDVRMAVEAHWLREAGGTLIHLQRDGSQFSREHRTECGVSCEQDDVTVRNPGTLAGLRGELLSALTDIRRRIAA